MFKILIMLLILFCPSMISAAGIVAVQSVNIQPYNEALDGFRNYCRCSVKRFIVSEMKGVDTAKRIRREDPDVIIAIGMDALNRVRRIKDRPIVYLMILNPASVISNGDNITGISMNIDPVKQVAVIKQTLPHIKDIGLLFNPAKTGAFVKRLKNAASAKGLRLVTREVFRSKDVPTLLKEMKGEISALWMLPDVTVVTPETVELLLLFSFENRIPVITFSDKYVEMGALMSISIDPYSMGRQAGELAGKILVGVEVRKLPRMYADKANITINKGTARKLGIVISKEILDVSKIVNGE